MEDNNEKWDTKTTTTDEEEEELDELLDEVDEAYDLVGGDWDDPFRVEGSKRGDGDVAKAKRKGESRHGKADVRISGSASTI